MSFHQCTELFVQLNVLCLGNWLHVPLRKKCGEILVFSIFHPTRLFRPTQLLIWMNLPPYTIIPHCTAIRHFTVCSSALCNWRNSLGGKGRYFLLELRGFRSCTTAMWPHRLRDGEIVWVGLFGTKQTET